MRIFRAVRLSRNFTVDIPTDANGATIDGPCQEEPDQSRTDPANVDENGHGTHVASIIGSPLNGLGVAGVAPNVTLVNIRAGQDSGFFFLQPTVDALTYAADAGLDVVNMSFYTDPWLFNCTANPAHSPENQAEQRTIIAATQRALRYAWNRNVTLVAAAGNQAIDYTKPSVDETSPDFADVVPAGPAGHRGGAAGHRDQARLPPSRAPSPTSATSPPGRPSPTPTSARARGTTTGSTATGS